MPTKEGLPNEAILAWAAGFIDGEGSFTLGRRPNGLHTPIISVGQRARRPLEELRELFGGSITNSRTRLGDPYFVWRLDGRRVMWPIALLMGYMRVKWLEAAVLYEYARSIGTPSGAGVNETERAVRAELAAFMPEARESGRRELCRA